MRTLLLLGEHSEEGNMVCMNAPHFTWYLIMPGFLAGHEKREGWASKVRENNPPDIVRCISASQYLPECKELYLCQAAEEVVCFQGSESSCRVVVLLHKCRWIGSEGQLRWRLFRSLQGSKLMQHSSGRAAGHLPCSNVPTVQLALPTPFHRAALLQV